MRVSVGTDNVIWLDSDDMNEIANFVQALRGLGESAPESELAPEPKKKRKRGMTVSEEIPLSPQLMETWNWMVVNNCSSGLSIQEVASGLNLQYDTANYRLRQLYKKGLVHRTHPGSYAPGEGPDWPRQPPADSDL